MSETAPSDSPRRGDLSRSFAEHFDDERQKLEATRLAMWIFLVAEILFFSGLFVAYAVFRAHHPEIFSYGHRYLDRTLGAVSTALLICSSVTAAWAVRAAALDRQRALVAALAVTILLGLAFLGVKCAEYSQCARTRTLWGVKFDPCASPDGKELPCLKNLAREQDKKPVAEGENAEEVEELARRQVMKAAAARRRSLPPDRVPPTNTGIFFSVYFGMTGLHALHVLAGVFVLAWLLVRARRRHFGPRTYGPVDAAALFWHVVGVIWFYIFGLLYLIP